MAKPSQLDRAIIDLDGQIRALEDQLRGLQMARDFLVLQKSTPRPARLRPAPVLRPKPGPAA